MLCFSHIWYPERYVAKAWPVDCRQAPFRKSGIRKDLEGRPLVAMPGEAHMDTVELRARYSRAPFKVLTLQMAFRRDRSTTEYRLIELCKELPVPRYQIRVCV